MASEYATPLALCQDILSIRSGGAAPTDDDNLQQRQVLYWISTFVATLFRQQIDMAGGVAEAVDRRLWQPVILQLAERRSPKSHLASYPKTFASAELPADILSSADTLLLRDLFWGDQELAQLPLATVRQGSVGFSRFGQPRPGWAVSGSTLYLSLPSLDDAERPLTGLAVKVPDYSGVIDKPEAPTPWPAEWNSVIRTQALTLLGATVQQVPDQKNNGADLQTDKK